MYSHVRIQCTHTQRQQTLCTYATQIISMILYSLKFQWPPFVESPLKVFSVFVLDKFLTQKSSFDFGTNIDRDAKMSEII